MGEFNLATALADATLDTAGTKSDYKLLSSDPEREKAALTLENFFLKIDGSSDTQRRDRRDFGLRGIGSRLEGEADTEENSTSRDSPGDFAA